MTAAVPHQAALEATSLSKRYGKRWALKDFSLRLPAGHIAALVGPNGAGKTTLMHLAVGLIAPTTGTVRLFGLSGRDNTTEFLSRVGFVAQDAPMYPRFRVRDMLSLGRHMNERWDDPMARSRIERLNIPPDQRVGHLSGGQRGQLSLVLAMAKRPEMLVLDEPVASLDPLARREFLQILMEEVAEHQTTVLLSSHLIEDLERVSDYLVLLARGAVQVAGEVADLLESHRLLIGPRRDEPRIPGAVVVRHSDSDRQTTLLIRTRRPVHDPAWQVRAVGLQDLVLAYMAQPSARALPGPELPVAAGGLR